MSSWGLSSEGRASRVAAGSVAPVKAWGRCGAGLPVRAEGAAYGDPGHGPGPLGLIAWEPPGVGGPWADPVRTLGWRPPVTKGMEGRTAASRRDAKGA